MRYEVIVAGTVIDKFDNLADAKACLTLIKNSYLAMVHPTNTFYIKKII